jgi:paraquat-inducible protein A
MIARSLSNFFEAASPHAVVATRPAVRECRFCGQFQTLPAMLPGAVARCRRCNAVMRRVRAEPILTPLAFSLAAVVLFIIACSMTLMDVQELGQRHRADLLTGPVGLSRNGLWQLGLVVLFTSVVAPLIKLGSLVYVLGALALPIEPPRHLRWVFSWIERIHPWSMVEVYLLGTFVAYVKLIDLVQIQIGIALYALFGTMLLMVAADALLDPDAVWEAMERRGVRLGPVGGAALTRTGLACEVCGLVNPVALAGQGRCRRCDSSLHRRKPDSITRTWALLLAALVLYLPANIYPVLTVMQGGAGQPSTILGGVEELISSGMYPLAALVFFASIAVPMLKIAGLMLLLLSTQTRRISRLRDRTRLYRIVDAVGRWSMIDIFMESILVALVQFGRAITIEPGVGAVAFCAVVILTMFAAGSFDPRLMWDAAAERIGEAVR